VQLAHPGYVNRMKQGPDKTDHGDAWLLADLGRVDYVPTVWLADETTRQLRRLVRYREGLKAERKNVKLRIRALLREERVPAPNAKAWTKAWKEWLKTASLGEESRWIMDREIEHLARLEADLRAVEKRMEESTKDDVDTQKLLGQEGIGLITAVSMRAAIGRFERFRSGKQLARFCGVTPCNASSGKRQSDSGMVKAGSRELRATIIQAAKRLPRHVSKWKELKQRLGQKKPANVATAAVANRWLRWLYHQMVTQPALERIQEQEAA
jgi:transposase